MLKTAPATSGLILQLEADLIMENSRQFYHDFIAASGDIGEKNILLDFSKTKFIDSSGIGMLLRCTEKVKSKKQGLLYLYGMNRQMIAVFKLSGLLAVLNIFDEELVAREKFPDMPS